MIPVKIKIKRGTTAEWTSSNIPLAAGELGYDLNTKTIKIGDGSTLWSTLLPLNKFEIDEISQDAIYQALTEFVSVGNNITVNYDDPNNSIVLDTGPNVALLDDISGILTDANEYTDLAVAGLNNQIGTDYVPISLVGNPSGVAQLGADGYVPDTQIAPSIARDSEIITSYNDLDDLPTLFSGSYTDLTNQPTLFSGSYTDLTNKPNIALAAVQWTANHYQLPGGANTRYLAGDIVYDGGSIFVANFDNESLPTTNTQYWTNIGAGNRLNIDGRDIPNIIWDNILNKPTLFSGSYTDLTDKPTLFSGSYNDLTDKPTIPSLTGYATETYVGTAISNLVDSAPETLNTLNELAAALGDDANYATTISTALGNKLDSATAASTYAPLSSPTFTGTVDFSSTTAVTGLKSVPNSVSNTSYTPALSDSYKTIVTTATSQVTITIPPDSETDFPLGTSLSILQAGSGQVVFAAGSGVTLNTLGNSGALKNRYQYAISGVYKYAANTWVALGDLII